MPARANIPDASGTVASREYEYHFPDGTNAAFAVTLCLSDDSEAAKVARDKGALAHGLVEVVGVPRAPFASDAVDADQECVRDAGCGG